MFENNIFLYPVSILGHIPYFISIYLYYVFIFLYEIKFLRIAEVYIQTPLCLCSR